MDANGKKKAAMFGIGFVVGVVATIAAIIAIFVLPALANGGGFG